MNTRNLFFVCLAGFFGTVAAVDGLFIYLAVTSNPGLAVDRPYERGLAHNAVLAEAERRRALGWTVEPRLRDGAVEVSARDAAGPLTGAAIAGTLLRPSRAGLDRPLAFTPAGPGRWTAALPKAQPGLWELDITITRGGDRHQTLTRVTLP